MPLPHHLRPLVYVAGPYVNPDPVENTHKTIMMAEALQASGDLTAYVPHLSLLWHLVAPHDAEHWYDYDLAILARCDALLRLPGQSTGADNEVLFAEKIGIPIFHTPSNLLEWSRHQ